MDLSGENRDEEIEEIQEIMEVKPRKSPVSVNKKEAENNITRKQTPQRYFYDTNLVVFIDELLSQNSH